MDNLPPPPRGRLGRWLAVVVLQIPAACLAANGYVTVHAVRVVPRIRAFARVVAVTDAVVRAGSDGRVEQLHVVPGSRVRAGQVIGRLGGIQAQARFHRDRIQLRAAQRIEANRRDALAIQRRRFAQRLSTRQQVDHAADALARAASSSEALQQQLRLDRALAVLRSPALGTVTAVRVHDGERVRTGQPLVRVLPDDALQLSAAIYTPGARRRLHPGMRGSFKPDDGSAALPVRLVQQPPQMRADGGFPIRLVAANGARGPAWVDGETGMLILREPAVRRIMVPTRALILDRGHWWVLVHTAAGDRRQAVRPGQRKGKRTVILQGLQPGMQVVVAHAYRRFHRQIAHRFQVQD